MTTTAKIHLFLLFFKLSEARALSFSDACSGRRARFECIPCWERVFQFSSYYLRASCLGPRWWPFYLSYSGKGARPIRCWHRLWSLANHLKRTFMFSSYRNWDLSGAGSGSWFPRKSAWSPQSSVCAHSLYTRWLPCSSSRFLWRWLSTVYHSAPILPWAPALWGRGNCWFFLG